MNRVLVVGSAVLDFVAYAPRFPRPGETVTGATLRRFPGGKGANQAVAAHRLGAEVSFCGCVGSDGAAEELRRALEGMDLLHLHASDATPSGVALITIDPSAQNQIVVAPGANLDLKVADVKSAAEVEADVVVTQLEIPLDCVEAALSIDGGLKVLNPAPYCEIPSSLLAMADIVTPNETEAEMLTGIAPTDASSCAAAAEALMAKGVGSVVITLGERGAFVAGPDGSRFVPSFVVEAVDTVGAGDTFNGALAAMLACGLSLEESSRRANVAAALSVTVPGAQGGMPSLAELEAALQR